MEIHSSYTSDIIRYDFLRFTRQEGIKKEDIKSETPKVDENIKRSLEEYRDEMSKDDGMGSYGSYKCPIW